MPMMKKTAAMKKMESSKMDKKADAKKMPAFMKSMPKYGKGTAKKGMK
tara:strand:+ start:340 stop:483 length:144 start_codon:yes stop_codon:yes gene_type:complete